MPTRGTLEVEGGRLAYELAGSGPPIVLIHSGITDRRQWDREVPRLAPSATVVRYDLRGFGGSSPASAPFSPVRDLRSVIVGLGLARPLLVASSIGGAIALDLALEHPGTVRGLLLLAPAVSGEFDRPLDAAEEAALDDCARRWARVAAAWSAGHRAGAFEELRSLWAPALEGAALDLLRRMVDENAAEVYEDRSFALAEEPAPAAPRLAVLRPPVRIVAGDRDPEATRVIARRIAAAIPGGQLTVVPGADHLVNLSAPEAFDDALSSLRDRVTEPAVR